VLALAAALGPASAGAQAVEGTPVRNPYWGVALFEVYQELPFSALTGLMASQHFDRVPLHADEAEVLRGGLLLDYGLPDEAERLFTRVIERGAGPAVRDKAWFHLARLRHQKGSPAAAEEALARIGNALPRDLDDRRLLLKAQLQMAREDFAGAGATLAALRPDSAVAPYARFNLGVARIKAGETAEGAQLLEAVGTAPAANEDLRSLRDKANLALGFAALQEQRADAARAALERVRLHGPQSNAALLGFGWAALQKKEPKPSLVAFQELSGRPVRDAAVLEAQIAEPFALAEAGAPAAALQRYELAVQVFGEEATRLDEGIAQVRSGALIEALLGLQQPAAMGGGVVLALGPSTPQPGHLAPLLAQHEMQESLKSLRDLRFLSGNLAGWATRLAVFDDMLAQRRQGFEQRAPQVRERAGSLGMAAQQQRLQDLASALDDARQKADGQDFADERERGLRERIAAARQAVQNLGDGDEARMAQERLRLAQGALTWQLAREQPMRQWEAQKALDVARAQLGEAASRAQALERAQREEPQRLVAFAQRIAEIRTRIAGLAPQVAVLEREQQQQAQELAAAELQRQKERLAHYTAQARLAIAQLHDQARLAQAPGGADAPR
jgi:hypothetical protein